jgi:hypothetical protein
MRYFLDDYWDAALFFLFLIPVLVFALIGVWTGNDRAGATAVVLAIPTVVFGFVWIVRAS